MSINRSMTFGGTNLVDTYGLVYSSFEEELPKPKVLKVTIPAGVDLDITEAVGKVAYSNGEHTLKFLLYGDTEADRLTRKRALISKVHGQRADYSLSWDTGYTYTGRAEVSIEHLFPNADLVTITIDRTPWKVHAQEHATVEAHPTATYRIEGSARLDRVTARAKQGATGQVNGVDAVTMTANVGATLAQNVNGTKTVTFTVDDWWQYIDGHNLVVNPSHITIADGNAQFDSNWVLNGTDLYCANAAKQVIDLWWVRKDL